MRTHNLVCGDLLSWFAILSLIACFSAYISKLDIITQITAFLNVVCTVIMGVSCRDGDFSMSLVKVILFLTFQQPDGISQSHHEDIISELPQSVNVALAKFNLNSWTTIYTLCPAFRSTYTPTLKTGSVVLAYAGFSTKPSSSIICWMWWSFTLLRQQWHSNANQTLCLPSFHDYLTGLLSHPDLEDAMDISCDTLLEALK